MRIDWKDNRASVGPLELRVRQVRSSGEWCADAWVSLLLLSSESGFESDAEAREWCERFVKSFAVPIADTARAEGAAAEREACAARLEESTRLLDGLAAECIAGSESRRIYETQAETLRAAIDAIRDRSNGGAR